MRNRAYPLGDTREPSELNAHPHCSDDRNVVGVHNGIIENYQELREKLQHKGYNFYSDTDTEVAIKLIDYYYKKYEHTPVDAINHAMVRIRGSTRWPSCSGIIRKRSMRRERTAR